MASNNDDEISSRHADSMLAALASVIDHPQVREMQQKVKTWMAERQQQLATNDLLQMLNATPGSPVDPKKLRACMKHCGAWPESAVELLPVFMKALIQDTVAKATSERGSSFPFVLCGRSPKGGERGRGGRGGESSGRRSDRCQRR